MPSLERPEEPLMPELPDEERSPLEDERSLLDDERSLLELDDEPFEEALRPPERSCELPRPELVLPEAPRPSLRSLRSPMLLELRSLPLELRSLLELELLPDAP